MCEILHGASAAAALTDSLKAKCEYLRSRGIVPKLAIVRVGARDDDAAYERAAMRRCEKIGIAVLQVLLPENCEKSTLLDAIDRVNNDTSIHGCLLFRPLKDREMETAARDRLLPEKDVDGMTRISQAHVFTGSGVGFAPCTAEACIRLLEHYAIPIEGKRVVILGRSLVVGKPLAMLMLAENATVTICHSRSVDEQKIAKQADILVAALGKAEHVDASYLSEQQIVLDVGIHEREDGTLCGDVRSEDAAAIAKAYAPVPGGVGSMTTTILAEHVIRACENIACKQ